MPEKTAGKGFLGATQEILKRYGKLYYLLIHLFAPVILSSKYKKTLKSIIDSFDADAVILNIGSGPQYLKARKDIINIDLYAFQEVDMVADAKELPIESESVDLIINVAMLEHVERPGLFIEEMNRILKHNGKFFCYLPFISPFHAAPHDFHRWTMEGIRNAFSQFPKSEVAVGAGPTSGLLWVFQEWIAILFSFGSSTLHDMLFIFMMILTAPVKLLDILLVHFPHAEKIASGFFIHGQK